MLRDRREHEQHAERRARRRRRAGAPVGCARQRTVLPSPSAAGYRSGKNGRMRDELRVRLVELGASDDDIDRAEAQGWLPLLAFERMLMPGSPEVRPRRAGGRGRASTRSWRSGCGGRSGSPTFRAGVGRVHRARRRRGAPRVRAGADARRRTRHAAPAGPRDQRFAGAGRVGRGDGLRRAARRDAAAGIADDEIALAVLDDARLADVGVLIDYVHRLQLRAAVWRRDGARGRARRRDRGRLRRSRRATRSSAPRSTRTRSRSWSAGGRRSRTTRSRRTARGS